MSVISIFMIGIGLSMDAFAVSIAKGMTMKKQEVWKYAIILGFFFGLFQAGMPVIGWWVGKLFSRINFKCRSLDCIWFIGSHRIKYDKRSR